MSLRVQLVALSDAWLRTLAPGWVANRRFTSTDDVRDWLGAMRMNLASELNASEPSFLVTAIDTKGKPALVLEVGREWPHPVTDGTRSRKRTTKEKSR